MTTLEDRVRAAIQAKASEIPDGAAPPLRLPARRPRLPSLVRGGGERMQAPAQRRWLAAAAAAVATTIVITAAVTASRTAGQQTAAGSAGSLAAQWVASQVSPAAKVSCDPVMCQVLATDGLPASRLVQLQPGSVAGSQVIVVTPAVRHQLGDGVAAADAPAVLASFGSGPAQVQVRVVAADGAAAFRSSLNADLQEREQSGAELLTSGRVVVTGAPRRQLQAGQVDARLCVVIAGMAGREPLSIAEFADSGPRASAGMPFRSATLVITGRGSAVRAAHLRLLLTFLHSEHAPLRPAQVRTVVFAHQTVLYIEFTAPSPFGVLG